MKVYAALTGDIVKSSKLPGGALSEVRKAVGQAAKDAGKWRPGPVAAQPDFFRGDAWQMVLAEPGLALRVALYIRASLKVRKLAETRIAIGVGRVEGLNRSKASLSTGPTMTASGLALDEMKSWERLTLATVPGDDTAVEWAQLAVTLVDLVVGRWQKGQAQAVQAALWPREQTHEEIALRLHPGALGEDLKAKRRGVTKSLSSAGWHGLEAALTRFEAFDWQGANVESK